MADLLQVIYSSDFHGAAMINGGPYNSLHYSDVSDFNDSFESNVSFNNSIQASHSVGLAQRNYQRGLIDNPDLLKDTPLLMLSETI